MAGAPQVKIPRMNPTSFLAVGLGAAFGAWLRWGLGLALNPLFQKLALGTLAANLLGAYLVGAAVAVFHINSDVPPAVKLFIITGFLGGLTTFSTFSAEVVAQIQRAEYVGAFGTVTLNLCGSLLLTGLGIVTIQQLNK